MKGKCNCGTKASKEFLITNQKEKSAWTIKLCDKCSKNVRGDVNFQRIDSVEPIKYTSDQEYF